MAKLIKKGEKYYMKKDMEHNMPSMPSKEENCDKILSKLVCYNASLQIAHWRANTVTNEHKTLGDLYESMIALTDKFAEAYMGDYGVVEFVGGQLMDLSVNPATKGCDIAEELCASVEDDDYLCNIVQDMQAELYKAKYLLKEK